MENKPKAKKHNTEKNSKIIKIKSDIESKNLIEQKTKMETKLNKNKKSPQIEGFLLDFLLIW